MICFCENLRNHLRKICEKTDPSRYVLIFSQGSIIIFLFLFYEIFFFFHLTCEIEIKTW